MDVSHFPDDKDNPSSDDGESWTPKMRVTKMQFDNLMEEEQCLIDSGPTSSVSHYNHCVRESRTFFNILSRESMFSYLTCITPGENNCFWNAFDLDSFSVSVAALDLDSFPECSKVALDLDSFLRA